MSHASRQPARSRSQLLRMSALVLEQVNELARLEALDVGKPVKQGLADAHALARYLEFYGGAADKVMGETIPFTPGYTALTLREPHGVTGHIVPWNYPMQIIGRSVGAALAMGNACVLKPAEEACLTALAFAHLGADAARVIVRHCGAKRLAQMLSDHASHSGWGMIWRKRALDFQTPERRRRYALQYTRLDELIEAGADHQAELLLRQMMFESRDLVLAAIAAAHGGAADAVHQLHDPSHGPAGRDDTRRPHDG